MMESVIPLFPGLPGGPELLIVLFVLVLLFGANKIPKLARSTGQAMGEFKRGREEIEEELEEMQNPAESGSTSTGTGAEGGTSAESSGTAAESESTTESETEAEAETESK